MRKINNNETKNLHKMENEQKYQSLNETQVKLPWTVYPQQTQISQTKNVVVNENKQNNTEFWF